MQRRISHLPEKIDPPSRKEWGRPFVSLLQPTLLFALSVPRSGMGCPNQGQSHFCKGLGASNISRSKTEFAVPTPVPKEFTAMIVKWLYQIRRGVKCAGGAGGWGGWAGHKGGQQAGDRGGPTGEAAPHQAAATDKVILFLLNPCAFRMMAKGMVKMASCWWNLFSFFFFRKQLLASQGRRLRVMRRSKKDHLSIEA